MAASSAARGKPSQKSDSPLKIFRDPKVVFAFALIFIDALLVFLIITFVPYTKIDWDAYMSQVTGFLQGERDYTNLKGDTGPLVYPAGFLYVYSAIHYVTGGLVYPAQILFGILYIVNLAILLFIYLKTDVLPWWALSLLCLSKRVHSIFVLRLFNDCFAVTLLHAALASLLFQRWHLGLIIFSGAVSIKMNVLLYAPPLLLLMLKAMNIGGVISALAGAAIVQILVGLPFIVSHPVAYISRAFNLGRVFIHFWNEGGLLNFLHSRFVSMKLGVTGSSSFFKQLFSCNSTCKILNEDHIVTTMFVGNFIGILCARSLHYQFYSWYFFSLPYLLWKTPFPTFLRLILFVGVELCWNVYPSNIYSSALLLCIHLVILWGLWTAPAEYPYVNDKSLTRNKNK
ncbi:dol-P-Man:Man(5)GlcNAc(2)-PP-Dol alpha-1,3-mannosyltransferase isoform X2 [Vitis vinifera]|uniref:dol-P-Man:Man(5)GlcNAc(2)-PP-Dol alpha-1,3-mannosyltransferase isoform X2 n=1 Tax=Vitis vinifera TaxID=29760 RepID=UPI0008FFD007|nr:dol-P-Man:Man(5)GlcNAc(2)-PP-Dol alpha-1,3-mannosyltransferase isoform X2 [Vitis vinifera]|eukprot:XP_019076396.1 PREDICTED: dol-P-Man:Man(5)GlcNAc(2)-PP-Dol alpha-1,3-mannosyltransferase isoform X2 [Vitis vinifera]